MLITISGSVSRLDVIHVVKGTVLEFHIDTFHGEKEVFMVSDVAFRSKFREKFNHYESLVGRRLAFKVEYKANESLKLVDCYLI